MKSKLWILCFMALNFLMVGATWGDTSTSWQSGRSTGSQITLSEVHTLTLSNDTSELFTVSQLLGFDGFGNAQVGESTRVVNPRAKIRIYFRIALIRTAEDQAKNRRGYLVFKQTDQYGEPLDPKRASVYFMTKGDSIPVIYFKEGRAAASELLQIRLGEDWFNEIRRTKRGFRMKWTLFVEALPGVPAYALTASGCIAGVSGLAAP